MNTKQFLQNTIENENNYLERLSESIETAQADLEKMMQRYHERFEFRKDLVKSLNALNNALNNAFPIAENT